MHGTLATSALQDSCSGTPDEHQLAYRQVEQLSETSAGMSWQLEQ